MDNNIFNKDFESSMKQYEILNELIQSKKYRNTIKT